MDPLDRIARQQHSLVTTAQLAEHGYSAEAIKWMVSTGELERVRRGVFRFRGGAPSQEQVWLAGVLGCAVPAVLSHLSVAGLHRLKDYPPADKIDLLTTDRAPRLPGVAGHRTLLLPPCHLTKVRLVPGTTVSRTLFDTCGLVRYETLRSATLQAMRDRQVSRPSLLRALSAVPVSGRRKIVPMVELMREIVPGFNPGGSDRELDVRKVIVDAGPPPPAQQFRVDLNGHPVRIDFAYPATMTGLEYEGYEFHRPDDSEFFHDGAARTRALQLAGWTIWPLTRHTTKAEIIGIAQLATGQDDST